MKRRILLLAAIAAPAAGQAWAQASIAPNPAPRLPPQPGQGLPIDDRRFLRDAMALSTAQAAAAARFAERITDEEARRAARSIAERHGGLVPQLRAMGQARGLQPDQPVPEAEAPSNPRVAAALQRLGSLENATERDFLAAQIEIHPVLVEMYQAQASNSADRELSHFAITTLVGIQEDFSAVAQAGGRFGLSPPERLLSNPPQYGPGAGPAR